MKIKSILLSSVAATGLFAIGTTIANADTVTVKAGDTVSAIAATHKTTVTAIQKANQLKNVNLIYIGDKLEVNGSTTKTVTATVPTSAASQSSVQSASSTSTTSAASQSSTTSASSTSQAASSATSQSAVSQSTASSSVASSASSSAASQATTATSASTTDLSYSTNATSSTTTTTSTSSSSEEAAKAWIANKESGGSYTASNGNYYGKYQLTKSLLNGDLSASNQEAVATAYVTARYGSWTAAQTFWEANGYY